MNPFILPTAPRSRAEMMLRRPRAFFSYGGDPRFSYSLVVPASFRTSPGEHRLVVAVHGSSRSVAPLRDGFAVFAETHRCIVLAPLFPIGPFGDGNEDGYKYLVEGPLRYDQVLLGMIDEVQAGLGCDFGRFFLTGFSGGGQFAHRFFYLHPDRLEAVSIGAPGAVTFIDERRDYWLGTRDWGRLFGRDIDAAALARTPVQTLVGALDDRDLWPPSMRDPGEALIAQYGRNRIQRTERLSINLKALGVAVSHAVLPGIGHEGLRTLDVVQSFFASHLAGRHQTTQEQCIGG